MIVQDVSLENNGQFDLVLSLCGYESRSAYILQYELRAPLKVAFHINSDQSIPIVRQNREYYEAAGWNVHQWGQAGLDKLVSAHVRRVCIDISSMPRVLIAGIVEFFSGSYFRSVEVTFVYFPPCFEESVLAAARHETLHAGPVTPFFAGELRSPRVPLGLVVGLGLESYRAMGIMELLEPERTWGFVGQSPDVRFDEGATAAHRDIHSGQGDAALLTYPVASFAETYRLLESLVFAARSNYRLIIAPSGPKMFSLIGCLVAAPRERHRPALWRVGSSLPSQVHNVSASGEVVAATVVF